MPKLTPAELEDAKLFERGVECGRKEAAKEIERLREIVVSFCAPWAVTYAKDAGLPNGHIYPTHYDILKECGARMVSFTRAEINTPPPEEEK